MLIDKKNKIMCIAYGLQYPKLDLKLFISNRWLYEYCRLEIQLRELQEKYFYCSRWNKPTKKGTNVRFKQIKDKQHFGSEMQKIRDYVKQINEECGFNFILEKEG